MESRVAIELVIVPSLFSIKINHASYELKDLKMSVNDKLNLSHLNLVS